MNYITILTQRSTESDVFCQRHNGRRLALPSAGDTVSKKRALPAFECRITRRM